MLDDYPPCQAFDCDDLANSDHHPNAQYCDFHYDEWLEEQQADLLNDMAWEDSR